MKALRTWAWSGVHNCVAHPLTWLFFEAAWTDRLHQWSAEKAWGKSEG